MLKVAHLVTIKIRAFSRASDSAAHQRPSVVKSGTKNEIKLLAHMYVTASDWVTDSERMHTITLFYSIVPGFGCNMFAVSL